MKGSKATLTWDGERARIRILRPGECVPFDNELVKNLVAMRKAGKLAGVWIDDERIKVRMPGDHEFEPLRSITRPEAYAMVDEWQRVKFLTKQELSRERMRAAGLLRKPAGRVEPTRKNQKYV